jgi:hypothetical protein
MLVARTIVSRARTREVQYWWRGPLYLVFTHERASIATYCQRVIYNSSAILVVRIAVSRICASVGCEPAHPVCRVLAELGHAWVGYIDDCIHVGCIEGDIDYQLAMWDLIPAYATPCLGCWLKSWSLEDPTMGTHFAVDARERLSSLK